MSTQKLRAAFVAFCVGFLLGLAVFAASRLLVRSVLSADAVAAAEQLAARLSNGEAAGAGSTFSTIVGYVRVDANGEVVDSAVVDLGGDASPGAGEIKRLAAEAASGNAVVIQAPLIPSLFGLSEPTVSGVAVPLAASTLPGAVYVEIDQTAALQSLGRAVSLAAVVTVGLAVLAIVLVAFGVARERGLSPRRKPFNPDALPHDSLLGLPMRQGFELALADVVERAAENDRQVGLIVVDLRGLRTVNDVWGHAAGDDVLKAAAQRLRNFAAGPAALTRIGADEFAIVVEKDASAQSLRHLADRIRQALALPYPVGGGAVPLGASVGAALYPVNAEDATALFRAASAALSRARAEGRSGLAVFDTEIGAGMRRHVELEHDLRQALGREEFVIFYQPQLELASGKVRGYEALVRWERPGQGILSPRDFLDVAEETGLIVEIGDWVLRKACHDAAGWHDSATVAVNLGAAQFRLRDVDQTIANVLRETGLPAERLEIEVPESLFLKPSHEILETLNRIKGLGARIVMDDFGASYSSLASIAHFPFDKIKIDKSFVAQLAQDADVAAVVASIVGLGRSLSVDVTAEGVETNDQVTLLKAAGCSIVQGFLFGMPKRDSSAEHGGDAVRANASHAGRT